MSKAKAKVRKAFNEAVFKRDGYKCRMDSYRYPCDNTGILEAHHITNRNEMPNGGYVASNGITLCPRHHLQVEMQDKKDPASIRHKLYISIGSHPETALRDASKGC